jgi:hypothetical protein
VNQGYKFAVFFNTIKNWPFSSSHLILSRITIMTNLRSGFSVFVQSFAEFYEHVYLPDHASPWNRWVHFLSNVAALVFIGLGAWFGSIYLFAVGIWCQLGPPYLGHILFEKTHRSIDQSPIFAAMGSWYTTYQILIGKQSVTHGRRL